MNESEPASPFERTLIHAFELWITPEIERRKTAGLIGETFTLSRAQILFGDEGPPMVRLNEEVKGRLLVQVSRAVKVGEPVREGEITEFKSMELLDSDLDFGHFTIFRQGRAWILAFNFKRNRKYAADLIALAEQFTDVAEFCWSKGFKGPFIDNLFSACELLAKAHLITTVLQRRAKSHGIIASRINMERLLRNVGDKFVDLFNRVRSLRQEARYTPGPAAELSDSKGALEIVRDEIKVLNERYSSKWVADAQASVVRATEG